MKYIDANKLIAEIEKRQVERQDRRDSASLENEYWPESDFCTRDKEDESIITIINSLQQEQNTGEVSDGYHTFNELYYYRMLYNAAFFNLLPKSWVHKSKRHHTGEECFGGGWFIVTANLPTGQVSNHYELKDWDLFKIPEKEFADEWDGHTPQMAAERIHVYLQQAQSEVDLDEEIDLSIRLMQGVHSLEDNKQWYKGRYENIKELAHHFYELGLKARKEE